MAAGEPFLLSYGATFLFDTLSADPFLALYCPGGVLGQKPKEEGAIQSLVRYWSQSAGNDKARQDGQRGRVLSTPTFVVVALDRQQTSSDTVYGTTGQKLNPPQPYLQLAQARIYALLHGQVIDHDGFEYELACAEYSLVEETRQGWRDVQVGWWVRMNVQ